MKKTISMILCFFILLSCVLSVQAASGVPKEVMEATKSVVRILAEHQYQSFTGSGFVIKNDGEEVLVATNDHVVEGNPQRISIWAGENRQVEAEIVFTIPAKDLCVLRITEPLRMEPLTLSEEPAQHGDAIYAVGYPSAGDVLSDTIAHTSDSATITDGIISAVRTFTIIEGSEPVRLLQVNAAINPGNSGGPLFNTKGEVIGVNTYKVNIESQGVFGSVDISELKKLLEEYDIVLAAEEPETEPLPTAAETEPVPTEEPEPETSPLVIPGIAITVLLTAALILLVLRSQKKKTVTLRDYMAHFPQGMPVGEAVSMLLPVAIQLKNMHSSGNLHLQVSPATILIGAKGAVLKDPSKNEMDRHASGFAAPEIYRGAGYGVASDIYSLAAALLFAVTGRMPANSLQQDALAKEIAALEEREPAFGGVIRGAMAFLSQDRTQSVQDLIFGISLYHNQEFRVYQPKTASKGGSADLRADNGAKRDIRPAPSAEEQAAKKAAQEAKAKEEAERRAAEQAAREAKAREEAERKAAEKAAREAKAKEEAERKAAEKAAREAKAKEEAERKAAEKAKIAAAEKAAREAAAAEAAKKKAEEKAAREAAAAEKAAKKAEEKAAREAAAAENAAKKAAEKAARKEAAGKKNGKPGKLLVPALGVVAVLVPLSIFVILPAARYQKADSLMKAGQYTKALHAFEAMEGYKDAEQKIEICREGVKEETYLQAFTLKDQKEYQQAMDVFLELGDYKDSANQVSVCQTAMSDVIYQEALSLIRGKDYETALQKLQTIPDHRDSQVRILNCKFGMASQLLEAWQYQEALAAFLALEEEGMDCGYEIQKCETRLLSERGGAPFVTHGDPVGVEIPIYAASQNGVTVHSMTRLDLDNECVRITLDCTMPACEFISIFNEDQRFLYTVHEGVLEAQRQTLVFDVTRDALLETQELTIQFGYKSGWICVRNTYQAPAIPIANYTVDGDVVVHSYSRRTWGSGITEYTMEFSADYYPIVRVFNPPQGSVFMKECEVTASEDKYIITYELTPEELAQIREITVSFAPTNNSRVLHFVYFRL